MGQTRAASESFDGSRVGGDRDHRNIVSWHSYGTLGAAGRPDDTAGHHAAHEAAGVLVADICEFFAGPADAGHAEPRQAEARQAEARQAGAGQAPGLTQRGASRSAGLGRAPVGARIRPVRPSAGVGSGSPRWAACTSLYSRR